MIVRFEAWWWTLGHDEEHGDTIRAFALIFVPMAIVLFVLLAMFALGVPELYYWIFMGVSLPVCLVLIVRAMGNYNQKYPPTRR